MSLDAEKTVLGASINSTEAFASACEKLRSSDFLSVRNGIIFDAMLKISERSEPIDLVTLKNQLAKTGKLDECGGVVYIASLTDGMPGVTNLDAWTEIIHNASVLRKLATVGAQIAQEASKSSDPPEIVLDRAESLIFAISDGSAKNGLSPISSDIKEAFKEIEESHEHSGRIIGVPSGLSDLDRITNGFQKSDLVIVAARPAMGKTSFCLNIASHAATVHKKPVAVFSLEMSRKQLIQRMIYSDARIDSQMVHRGQLKDKDWKALTRSWNNLHKLPIYIDDTSSLTPIELRAKCRRIKSEHGLGLVVIDYLQLLSAGVRRENANQDISFISRSLKGLAKELDVPVICLSQLSRKAEERVDHKPQLSDLRDSGAIEQDADMVLFLYRDSMYKPLDENRNDADIIVSKNRKGPTGNVKVRFFPEYTTFENATYGSEESN